MTRSSGTDRFDHRLPLELCRIKELPGHNNLKTGEAGTGSHQPFSCLGSKLSQTLCVLSLLLLSQYRFGKTQKVIH